MMTAKTVEDLELWKRATSFWKGANALLDRPAFDGDWKLRNQLRDATDSVLSNIAEGFEQRRTEVLRNTSSTRKHQPLKPESAFGWPQSAGTLVTRTITR